MVRGDQRVPRGTDRLAFYEGAEPTRPEVGRLLVDLLVCEFSTTPYLGVDLLYSRNVVAVSDWSDLDIGWDRNRRLTGTQVPHADVDEFVGHSTAPAKAFRHSFADVAGSHRPLRTGGILTARKPQNLIDQVLGPRRLSSANGCDVAIDKELNSISIDQLRSRRRPG